MPCIYRWWKEVVCKWFWWASNELSFLCKWTSGQVGLKYLQGRLGSIRGSLGSILGCWMLSRRGRDKYVVARIDPSLLVSITEALWSAMDILRIPRIDHRIPGIDPRNLNQVFSFLFLISFFKYISFASNSQSSHLTLFCPWSLINSMNYPTKMNNQTCNMH